LFIVDPFGNAIGGLRRGGSNYDLLCLDLVVNTNEFLALSGGQFHVGFAVNFGTSLSRHYVGNTFPIQLADVAGAQPRLTYLSYTQALFEDRLSLRLGRVTVNSVFGQEFMGSEYFKAMASVAFNLIPIGLFLSAPGAFGYPETTWGARIKFEPVPRFYAMGAQAPGLPRNVKAGIYFNGGPFEVLGASGSNTLPRTVHGIYGLYILGDQVLSRWGDSSQNRHLGLFGAFLAIPDQRLNSAPYFFDGGLVAYGLVTRRPKDFAAMGAAYGSYTANLLPAEQAEVGPVASVAIRHFESTIEWTYGCVIRPGLVVQPSLQYIIHPKGTTATPSALAIGVNLVINF
jgi:porin